MTLLRPLLILALGLGLISAMGCKVTKRDQKEAVTAKADSMLLGTWRRSHEDEQLRSDGARVWRNTKYHEFPPARGREGITFLPEGQCIFLAIAPTDGTQEQPGRYGWGGPHHLKITLENGRLITLRVKELTAEKLIAEQE